MHEWIIQEVHGANTDLPQYQLTPDWCGCTMCSIPGFWYFSQNCWARWRCEAELISQQFTINGQWFAEFMHSSWNGFRIERPDSGFSICGEYIGLRECCSKWSLHKSEKVMLGYPSAKQWSIQLGFWLSLLEDTMIHKICHYIVPL